MTVQSYQNLTVWQKSMDLVECLYEITNDFPNDEKFGLALQIKRAAVSIPSNIAEGSKRGTKKDYRNFLFTAYGSGAELETQLQIALRLGFISQHKFDNTAVILEEVMKMLNAMIQKTGGK